MTAIVVTDTAAFWHAGLTEGRHPVVNADGRNWAEDLDIILGTATNGPGTSYLLRRLPTPFASTADLAAEVDKRDGWKAQPDRTGTGWVTCRNATMNTAVSIGIRALIDPADPVVGSLTASDAMYALVAWSDATGTHYRHNPGHAMSSSILALTKGYRRTLQHPGTAEYWKPPGPVQEWRADVPRSVKGTLHRWDMRAAYLAAAAQVELPRRQLQNTGPDADVTQPGYVRVRVGPAYALAAGPWWRWVGRPDRHGCLWTVTPLYREMMPGADIIDSWMPPPGDSNPSGRILRPWADTIRDALQAHYHPTDIRPALKAGYAHAIGLLNVPRGALYRPDWRHLIIGTMQASLIRRLRAVYYGTGRNPVAVNVDSVTYAGDGYTAAISDYIGCGEHIGQMVYQGEVQR